MKINGIEYFFDIGRQKYVMFLPTSQSVVRVEREHIFKAYLSAYGEEQYRKNKKEILDKVEMRYLVFDPHRPRSWQEDSFFYQNTYIISKTMRQAKAKREKASFADLNMDIAFLSKYPNIDFLLTNLFVSQDRKSYFINWLATALNTLEKNGTTILLKGAQGAGKGILYEQIIQHAFGSEYCTTLSNEDLKSNFNHALENKLFVVANEIKGDFRDGNSAYEKLKMYITDSDLRIEQKGVDSRKATNHFNMMVFSNNETPLQIQGNDRRYTVYETDSVDIKRKVEKELKTDIINFLEGIKAERDNFIIDIMLFNYDRNLARTCQKTDEKDRIYRASMTKIEILADKIKSHDYTILDDILEIMESERDEEEVFAYLRSKKILIVDESLYETIEFIKIDMKKDAKANLIKNNYLTIMYHYFVSATDTNTKMGSHLTTHFGKSINTRTDGVQIRYRNIDQIKNIREAEEAEEVF